MSNTYFEDILKRDDLEPYVVVAVERDGTATGLTFRCEGDARQRADEYAQANPGVKCIVFCFVASCIANQVVWTELPPDDADYFDDPNPTELN